jgi:hypothetical protein
LPEALYWKADELARSLGDLPDGTLSSAAIAISRDGTWIAGYGTSGLGEEAVLWDEHRRLYRMQDVLDASGATAASGWQLQSCYGIARNGDLLTICGSGTNPSGHREAWVARVSVAGSTPTNAAPARAGLDADPQGYR